MGASQPAKIGPPMQVATISGTAAVGAGDRIAPAQMPALTSAVSRAAARTRRGLVHITLTTSLHQGRACWLP